MFTSMRFHPLRALLTPIAAAALSLAAQAQTFGTFEPVQLGGVQ